MVLMYRRLTMPLMIMVARDADEDNVVAGSEDGRGFCSYSDADDGGGDGGENSVNFYGCDSSRREMLDMELAVTCLRSF